MFLTAYDNNKQNNPNLPPNPKQTVKLTEGIDSDGNGARDDMQIAIYERHPNLEKRTSLEQHRRLIKRF